MARQKVKTFTTGWNGRSKRAERFVAKGWEHVSTSRYGWHSNKITLRSPAKVQK